MASRRHPEDSVIASIDQVQAMLRDEVAPAAQPELEAHAATQVTHRAGYLASDEPSAVDLLPDLSVPTAAEVEASRAARWAEESTSAPRVTRGRRRGSITRVLLALVLLAVGALGGWLAHGQRPPATSLQPLVQAADDAISVTVGAQRAAERAATVARLKAEVDALRLKSAGLEAQLADRAASPASVAPPAAKPSSPTPTRRKPRRETRRRRSRSSGLLVTRPGRTKRAVKRSKPRRRRSKPLNRQDKKLDALIQGL